MRRLAIAALVAGCSVDAGPIEVDAGVPEIADATVDARVADPDLARPAVVDAQPPADALLPGGTILLTLDAGAFPPGAHPSALVYIPRGFDPTPPIPLVVFLHGWYNCVENVVRDGGAPCAPGGPSRQAYSLVAQLEASGKRALLLVPELSFDRGTSDPGRLGTADGFRALLVEALADLAPALGRRLSPDDLRPIVVASHSGGYLAAAGIAARGGVPVDELHLLDSLYGATADFDAWAKKDLAALAGSPPSRRFADVYTSTGGTDGNSRAMADRAAKWVAPDAGVLVDDRTTATWPDATYRHGLLFKLSGLSHDGVVRYYFGKLVATSALPPR